MSALGRQFGTVDPENRSFVTEAIEPDFFVAALKSSSGPLA